MIVLMSRKGIRQGGRQKPDLEEFKIRFWNRTERQPTLPGQDVGCLNWIGTLDAHGYGQVGWGRNNLLKCHRLVMEWSSGTTLVSTQKVLHGCDNPRCVEISHLRVGTQLENIADMNARGRHHKLFGENAPRAKITERDARFIRYHLYHLPRLVVAEKYGITRQSVSAIVTGRSWRYLSTS